MRICIGVFLLASGIAIVAALWGRNDLASEKNPARLVERALKDIEMLSSKAASHLLMNEAQQRALENKRFDTFIAFRSIAIKPDPNDSGLVHYRLRVPGVSALAMNIMCGRHCPNAGNYVKHVTMQGAYRIRENGVGGMAIDISSGKDPISLYLALTFPSSLPAGYKQDRQYKNDEEFLLALSEALSSVFDAYQDAITMPNEALATITEEIGACLKNLEVVVRDGVPSVPVEPDWQDRIVKVGIAFGGLIGIVGVIILSSGCAQVATVIKARRTMSSYVRILGGSRPRNDTGAISRYDAWRDGDEIVEGVMADVERARLTPIAQSTTIVDEQEQTESSGLSSLFSLSENVLMTESQKTAARESAVNRTIEEWRTFSNRLRYVILHYSNAVYDKPSLLFLAEWVAAINREHATREDVTLAGWALAAIGRAMSSVLKPDNIEQEIKHFQAVWNRYSEKLRAFSELHSKRQALLSERPSKTGDADRLKEIDEQLAAVDVQIRKEEPNVQDVAKKGVLHSVIADDCMPIGYLMHILTDTAGHYDNFVKQGVIMGLLDTFLTHRDNPHVAPYFKRLITIRANLIADAQEMSFFEVRVPYTCRNDEYAAILKIVLRCANPSLQYADADALIQTAFRSIPGVMDLLCQYPLRLIDPGNAGKEGFYDFEPFKHALWTQYIEPKGSGRVIRRYHQVLDMTIPNASAVNVRLFMDPYLLVPVLFHEYAHFLEDHNEASVFLRTQMFSLRFYRKHRAANAALDRTFAVLCKLLGKKPDPRKVDAFNNIILRYYGPQKDPGTAEKEADRLIAFMNTGLREMQQKETWHPEIWYPQLGADDESHGQLIHRINVRYATAPRTISSERFRAILRHYMPVPAHSSRRGNLAAMLHRSTE